MMLHAVGTSLLLLFHTRIAGARSADGSHADTITVDWRSLKLGTPEMQLAAGDHCFVHDFCPSACKGAKCTIAPCTIPALRYIYVIDRDGRLQYAIILTAVPSGVGGRAVRRIMITDTLEGMPAHILDADGLLTHILPPPFGLLVLLSRS